MIDETDEFDTGLGLENTHVLITGASGAIGSGLVKAFLSAGCCVSALDLKKPEDRAHERLLQYQADITNEADIARVFEEAAVRFGPVQVCVAAAGRDLSYIPLHSAVDKPLEEWQQTIRTNLDGTFLTCRAWLRGVRQHRRMGSTNLSLIVLGSEAGSMGVQSAADYAASKAGVEGLVRSLAPDVVSIHPDARVNLVAPGPVDTPQFRKECMEDPQALWIEAEATVAQKRPVPTSAVARTCLFLASDRYSSSITGQTIHVNGGKSGKLFHLPEK